jgi:DNA repair ATPase RecN
MTYNDLANMLAIVSGDPEITKKLKNKNQAQAMRQRQPVPIMAVRRYLHTFEEHFKNLTNLERSLNITDANYKNVRRAVANYTKLDTRTRSQVLAKLKQMLQAKLPNTDIQRKFKEL